MTPGDDLTIQATPPEGPGLGYQTAHAFDAALKSRIGDAATNPVADHIADKHAAMLSTHNDRKSTRYRDLVDLVLLATTHTIDATDLYRALLSEYAHRDLKVPTEFTLPSDDWVAGYEQAAKTAPNLPHTSATAAVQLVAALLNPVLAGRNDGTWNPTTATWED